MADRTAIQWTDATWTPIRARHRATGKIGWHCEHASEGCRFCYAETFNRDRLGTGLAFKPGHLPDVEIFLDEKMLLQPLRWKRPRMIFVCSMTDLFGAWVPDAMIDRVFAVMALCPQHVFQLLTKRSARMRAYLAGENPLERLSPEAAGDFEGKLAAPFRPYGNIYSLYLDAPLPLRNVWLGVSTEDQRAFDDRGADLAITPAAKRFISYEPALGPLNLSFRTDRIEFPFDWVICGGESGPNARPMHPQWARDIRDQCAAAGVPFHFKQRGAWSWLQDSKGEWPTDAGSLIRLNADGGRTDDGWPMQRVGKKSAGRLLDGVEHNGIPEQRS